MCPPNQDEPASGGEGAVVPLARDVADQHLGPAGSGARLVIDHAATGFALFSAECQVLYGNHALASLFGYTEPELLTVDPWQLIVLDEGLDPARLLAPGDAGRPGANSRASNAGFDAGMAAFSGDRCRLSASRPNSAGRHALWPRCVKRPPSMSCARCRPLPTRTCGTC